MSRPASYRLRQKWIDPAEMKRRYAGGKQSLTADGQSRSVSYAAGSRRFQRPPVFVGPGHTIYIGAAYALMVNINIDFCLTLLSLDMSW